jgi:hypothetical protein
MLDPTKIGYLRAAPSSTGPGAPASGPTKAMLNKLAKTGHVSVQGQRYRRTELGDAAVAAFDKALTDTDISVLRAVSRDQNVSATAPGFKKLLDSRLVRIRSTLESCLTHEGRVVLDQR